VSGTGEVGVARAHLTGLYALLGLTVGSWLSRLPTVRTQLHLSEGQLGSVLLAGSLGSLAMLLVAGTVATRWGSRRALVAAAWVYGLAAVLLGLGPQLGSVAVLTAGVVLVSASFALGNVPLNVEAVVIERRMRRTVVPTFHAAFSVGSVLGSGIGAVCAWLDVPLVVQFSVVAVGSLVWRLVSVPSAVLAPAPGPVAHGARGRAAVEAADAVAGVEVATQDAAAADPVPAEPGPTGRRRRGGGPVLDAWRDPRTLLIAVIVMTGGLSEGTANTWVALGVVDGFAAREAVGALVFATFVAAMTVSRVAGTRIIDRFGRGPVLLASTSTAVLGLALFALAPALPLAIVGVVAWGVGAGLVVPIGMAEVTGHGPGAAARVAVASALASAANLVAPPVIGLVAERVGVRHAALCAAAVMLVGVVLAARVRAQQNTEVPVPLEAAR
jgi:MFS family permease